ncbi:MAG: hypothetical protein HY543_08695 [Deltaproteobacteria bacterium]|nr:hypothetical protein [Deltaproteobacteria bacterium]
MARRTAKKGEYFWSHISPQDWLEFAKTHKNKLVKEIEHLLHEIMAKIAESPILANREQLIHEARVQFDHLIRLIREGTIGKLNIPTQHDLRALKRKMSQLETKVNTLDKEQHPPTDHPPIN